MKEERIDNYVMGKMTADERLSFEQEMAADVALQKEVALHREIVQAIRMKAAKVHLQKVERQIRADERRDKIFGVIGFGGGGTVGIGAIYSAVQSWAYKAVAAALIPQMLNVAVSRGPSPEINNAIKAGEYKQAIELIDTALAEEFDPATQDESQFKGMCDELEWYKAVTYMRMGKWVKARKLLKQIAASDSAYSEDAQKALEEL